MCDGITDCDGGQDENDCKGEFLLARSSTVNDTTEPLPNLQPATMTSSSAATAIALNLTGSATESKTAATARTRSTASLQVNARA